MITFSLQRSHGWLGCRSRRNGSRGVITKIGGASHWLTMILVLNHTTTCNVHKDELGVLPLPPFSLCRNSGCRRKHPPSTPRTYPGLMRVLCPHRYAKARPTSSTTHLGTRQFKLTFGGRSCSDKPKKNTLLHATLSQDISNSRMFASNLAQSVQSNREVPLGTDYSHHLCYNVSCFRRLAVGSGSGSTPVATDKQRGQNT